MTEEASEGGGIGQREGGGKCRLMFPIAVPVEIRGGNDRC
jgi:hypothetical protein